MCVYKHPGYDLVDGTRRMRRRLDLSMIIICLVIVCFKTHSVTEILPVSYMFYVCMTDIVLVYVKIVQSKWMEISYAI